MIALDEMDVPDEVQLVVTGEIRTGAAMGKLLLAGTDWIPGDEPRG